MERRMAQGSPRIDMSEAFVQMVELARAYGDGTLGHPSAFFPAPALPDVALRPAGDGPLGTQVVDLAFRSEYTPFLPIAREAYLARSENLTARARWWTSDRGRPTIVVLHGWGGGNHWVTQRSF